MACCKGLALIVALCAGAADGDVVLSEVMYDPTGPESHDEYVEVVNTSDRERVDLTGWCVGDGDELDLLRDTGAGIPPTQRRWIFEAFASGSETANGESSLGLGLTIAKALTELHHGHIRVESEVGKGSTFAISLPLLRHEVLEPSVRK